MAVGSILLPVQSAKLEATGPAIDAGEANWRLLFDAAAAEYCTFQFQMPVNYASALVAKPQFTMASATGGAVVLSFEAMAVTPADIADIVTDSYDTPNTAIANVAGTAGHLAFTSVTLTNADSVAANDYFKVRVGRVAADGSDSALADCELVALNLQYTTT